MEIRARVSEGSDRIGAATPLAGRRRCPYCHTDMDDALVTCPERGCATAYHLECWAECQVLYGACAVMGCPGRELDAAGWVRRRIESWRLWVQFLRRRGPWPWSVGDPELDQELTGHARAHLRALDREAGEERRGQRWGAYPYLLLGSFAGGAAAGVAVLAAVWERVRELEGGALIGAEVVGVLVPAVLGVVGFRALAWRVFRARLRYEHRWVLALARRRLSRPDDSGSEVAEVR